jgi:hypothetical protein
MREVADLLAASLVPDQVHLATQELTARAQLPDHLYLLLQVAGSADRASVRLSALIQLQQHPHAIVSHSLDFFSPFFALLMQTAAACDPFLLPTVHKLANRLALASRGEVSEFMRQMVVSLLPTNPRAAVLFASACVKSLSPPGPDELTAYNAFCDSLLPSLVAIIRAGDWLVTADAFHLLARCTEFTAPEILLQNGELSGSFIETAFSLCELEIPLPLCENCLHFLANAAMFADCSPAFLDLACKFGVRALSERVVSLSLKLIYGLLRRGIFMEGIRERFGSIITQIVFPQLAISPYVDDDESYRIWHSSARASRDLVVLFVRLFDDVFPALLAFVSGCDAQTFLPALNLLTLIADQEFTPDSLIISRFADFNLPAFHAFVEWLLSILASASEEIASDILEFLAKCAPVHLTARHVFPLLPLMKTNPEAVITVSALAPEIPDEAERALLRDHLIEIAPELFDLFRQDGAILAYGESFQALRRLLETIAPSMTTFPPSVISDFIVGLANSVHSEATAAINLRASIIQIFKYVPIDMSEYLPKIADMLAIATNVHVVDDLIEMMCCIVRGPIAFRAELWALVPMAFDLVQRHDYLCVLDVRDLVVNLIWKGAGQIGPVAEDLLAQAGEACGDWADPYDSLCFLLIVAAIGRAAPGAAAPVRPHSQRFLRSEDAESVQMRLWPFLEFLAVQYPREVAADALLVTQLVSSGTVPGVYAAVMSLAPFLAPDVLAEAVRGLEGAEPPSDLDGAVPIWYDTAAVSAQFQQFLDAYVPRAV